MNPANPATTSIAGSRIVVTGAGGQLGGYLCAHIRAQGATVIGLGRSRRHQADRSVDITDRVATSKAIGEARPDIVIHAAAYTDVDGCERDPLTAEAINISGSVNVGLAAKSAGAHLVAVSTDFVFDGTRPPYAEDATTNPISVYGRTKCEAERKLLEMSPEVAIARTAWLYGGPGKHFPRTVLNILRTRGSIEVVDDETGSPTFAGDLARALVALSVTRASGVFHLVNEGSVTRFDFGKAVARASGFEPTQIRAVSTAQFLTKVNLPAKRPPNSTLVNYRAAAIGVTLRPWTEALADYAPHLAYELGTLTQPTGATTA
jgi:dTDP-4-dehydrorhamnose reductase